MCVYENEINLVLLCPFMNTDFCLDYAYLWDSFVIHFHISLSVLGRWLLVFEDYILAYICIIFVGFIGSLYSISCRFGHMVACFRYASINIFSVYLPPHKLDFDHGNQEWIHKELDEVQFTVLDL